MPHKYEVGHVVHLYGDSTDYFYLIYNRSLNEEEPCYDLLSIFSFSKNILKQLGLDESFYMTSLFGRLNKENRLHDFFPIVRNLISSGNIDSVSLHGLSPRNLSYDTCFHHSVLSSLSPLEMYPEEIHHLTSYFMNPANLALHKPISPTIHLD